MTIDTARRTIMAGAAAAAALRPWPDAFAQTSAVKLHHIDVGQGRPAVVFIHGVTCNLEDWRQQVAALQGRWRCIAVDLPGHGKSAAVPQPSIPAMAAAVNATLDSIGVDQVVFVGHSMGCRVASEAFSQSPRRVRGMVYVDGSLLSGDPEAAAARARQMIAGPGGMNAFIDRLYDDFFVASSPPEVRAFVGARRKDVDPDYLGRVFVDFVRWDAARSMEVLKQLNVPTLVIQSTSVSTEMKRISIREGDVTPWMKAVRETVRDSTIVTVPGVGHFTMLEAPAKTNALLIDFLGEVG